MPYPPPAYLATTSPSPLIPDRSLYTRIHDASREHIYTYTIPARSGHAFKLPATCILRISTPSGPQVADLNLWSLSNPLEHFWASRTRQLHASHVTVGDRLWSCLPYLRPMVTIIADSLQDIKADEHGARVHDLLGTRCDPYVALMLSGGDDQEGASFDYHCHSNLTRAVLPFGLTERDVHDVLNLFQVTGLDDGGRYFMKKSPAKAGDYIEFFAEIDCLVALSACPGGDLSQWGFGKGKEMESVCRELKVDVFKIEESEKEQVLEGWKAPEAPRYLGMHELKGKESDAMKRVLEQAN
ncbi:MAG: hypothetical protein Q9227_000951 [Pyrenula ochraceoflavens]